MRKLLTIALLALAGSCAGLKETATTAPYAEVHALLEPVEARVELWVGDEDPIMATISALDAWPVGLAYPTDGEVRDMVKQVCDVHDTIAPSMATIPLELKVWTKSTAELRAWFFIEPL